MAVLLILLLVCASLVAFISADHIASGDAVFNEHVVWISLGHEKYTCADLCHELGGSCDVTQFSVLTRKTLISKVLPYAVNILNCGGPRKSWIGMTLDEVKLECDLVSKVPIANVKLVDDDAYINTIFDDDMLDNGASQYFRINPEQTCYERGIWDDDDYSSGGFRVLCPCIYDSTYTPTESPTEAPTPVPIQAPTRHPTVNHPAFALEKKFAKIETKLEKDKIQDQKEKLQDQKENAKL